MSGPPSQPDLDWTAQGAPRSTLFDDIYFSAADGLAESRAVFLQGCGLPEGWRGRPRFTVGELGFGTGLNILALLDAWRRTRAPGQRLSIFSVEAYPLAAEAAARALAAWPELEGLAGALLRRWPRRAAGFHRLDFPELGASLDLAVGEAAWALEAWTGQADAWFLDGFSPAKNPQMWREAVLAGVARRSAPGARLATFTVAGAVRRGLQAVGFEASKAPGHGAKRERLEARLAGTPPGANPAPRTAVIGAGIAGAALARALEALGARPIVLEAQAPGAGASGNPAAVVAPGLDAGGGARAALYAQALTRAADLYGALGPQAVTGRGVLQLEWGERDGRRFDAVTASGLFDPARLLRLNARQAAERAGQPVKAGALWFEDGLVVKPQEVIEAWLAGGELRPGRAARLERHEDAWRVLDADGRVLAEAEAVCIACGAQAQGLWPSLPLSPVRGQASWAAGPSLACAVTWGGYAAPLEGGILFGATHDRGREDSGVSQADQARNLATLAEALPGLAAGIEPANLGARAGLRAAAPDRLPLAGGLDRAGLYVLAGLGSRGFTTAPLLAEHVAAHIHAAPSPLPADLQRVVDPSRFA